MTITTAADFNFPVELQDLFTSDGKLAKRKAVVRTDKNLILGDVSDKYKLIHHSFLFERADEYMRKFGDFTATFHEKNNGSYMMAEYTFKNIGAEVKKGDTIGFKLYFRNGYTTDSAAALGIKGLRLVCTNGMTTPYGDTTVKYRHTGDNIENGQILNMEFPKPERMLQNFHDAVRHWQHLASQELDESRFYAIQQAAIEAGIVPQMVAKKEVEEFSVWGLYNQFTHHITHHNAEKTSEINRTVRFDRVSRWFNENFGEKQQDGYRN